VRPTDCVLEIGFGPGVAIGLRDRPLGGDGAPSNGPKSRGGHGRPSQRPPWLQADLSALGVLFDKVLIVNNFGMGPPRSRVSRAFAV
jgi:hypothetical protein